MSTTAFKFQGIDARSNILQDVCGALSLPGANIIITSAYLRERAVAELADILRQAGGRGLVIVGIRNGVTSCQALKALVATGVQVYVVDTGAADIIFHSKLYAAYTSDEAVLICGSANFTPSGLWRSFEAITTTRLDLTDADDRRVWDSVRAAIDQMLAFDPENVFRVENNEKVDELLLSGRVANERIPRPSASVGSTSIGSGKGVPRIKSLSRKVPGRAVSPAPGKKSVKKGAVVPAVCPPSRYVEVWKSKELVRRDLNLPNAQGTNPTGSMLLKKGQYDIDQQVYFRFTAFADHDWSARPDKPAYFQYAEVNFRFVINSIDYGVHKVEIKYDSRTDTATYHQKQPMASISWGDCKQFICDESLLGRVMTIYRDTDSGKVMPDGSRKDCTYLIDIA